MAVRTCTGHSAFSVQYSYIKIYQVKRIKTITTKTCTVDGVKMTIVQQLHPNDSITYCNTPWAVFYPAPHRPPRWHKRSFSPKELLHKKSPQQPRSRCSETNVSTLRRWDAMSAHYETPDHRNYSGVVDFFSPPGRKTFAELSFSAGDQRRHVWRRSCCCSPAWRLHSCRSGLFSLEHSHKTKTEPKNDQK